MVLVPVRPFSERNTHTSDNSDDGREQIFSGGNDRLFGIIMRYAKKSEFISNNNSRNIMQNKKVLLPTAIAIATVLKKRRRVFIFIAAILVGYIVARYQQDFKQRSSLWDQFDKTSSKTSPEPLALVNIIIVLGEKLVNGTTIPSTNLQSRVRMAQQQSVVAQNELHKRSNRNKYHEVVHVIFSGGDTARVNKTEATVMNELWKEYSTSDSDDGDDDDSIQFHLDHQSLSTCQNAFYSIPLMEQICSTARDHPQQQLLQHAQRHQKQKYFEVPVPLPLLNVVVVTSDYHVARTRVLFEQVFASVIRSSSCMGLTKMTMDVIAAPMTGDTNLRKQLFENERHWLQPESIKLLLLDMKDHPFVLPSNVRLKQAREELNHLE